MRARSTTRSSSARGAACRRVSSGEPVDGAQTGTCCVWPQSFATTRAREHSPGVSGQARPRAFGRREPCRRRVSCFRRSTAASTGIRASTCTGCSRACSGCYPDAEQRERRYARVRRALRQRQTSRASALTSRGPRAAAFERTYGWAWLLKLARELARLHKRMDARWQGAARAAGGRIRCALYRLPAERHAIRSATACMRTAPSGCASRSIMRACGAEALRSLCARRRRAALVRRRSRRAGVHGSRPELDFLSPALIEADLMRRVLPPHAFGAGCDGVPSGHRVRAAGHVVHAGDRQRSQRRLHRASRRPQSFARVVLRGNRRCIATVGCARRECARGAGARHRRAGLEGVASGDYAGEHWLATFAVLAMTADD